MKLRTKFILVLMLFTSIFMGYVHLFWLAEMKAQVKALSERETRAHVYTTSEGLIPFLLENQLANVHETLNAIRAENPDWLQVTLYTPSGDLLYPLDLPEPVSTNKAVYEVEQEIGFLDPPLGLLKVTVDLSTSLAVAEALEYKLGIAMALMMLAFIIGITLEIEFMVARPLAKLVAGYRALVSGDYELPVRASGRDEISELAKGFVDMRQELQQYHDALTREVAHHRRKADKLEQKHATVSYEASHDLLTGLVNRREFERRLVDAFDESQAIGTSQCLLFIDLDRFKQVNDSCGHDAGDELLKEVSVLMRSVTRERDLLARFGGDEFGLLLNGCGLQDAEKIADKLCFEIAQYKFFWEGAFFSIGASIGVAQYSTEVSTPKDWLKQADMACYSAKEQGRGCFSTFTTALAAQEG